MKPPKNPAPLPNSKTQQRMRESRMRRPVTVIACAECGHTEAPLKKDGERYICSRCAPRAHKETAYCHPKQ